MTQSLINGFNKRFRQKAYDGHNPVMPGLVEYGQKPDYFILACADSRSDPATIFDAAPGSFFGFKSIGAIVRPYQTGTALAASLQYAINYLNVKKLVLLGHTNCGAIKAIHDKTDDPEIASFVDVAQDAYERAKTIISDKNADYTEEDLLRVAEEQILLQSMQNLKTYPSVANALAESRLEIETWIFEMSHGNILKYDPFFDAF